MIVDSWLTRASEELDGLVREVHLFGSFLDAESHPADVDVLIVFTRWNVAEACTTLRRNFVDVFNLRLHIQMFHESQVAEVSKFLRETRESRRLV
jgi:predicted nucleotidyltransferase